MRLLLLLILAAFLSLLPNLNAFPFRGEEATRAIVAFEMAHSGKYFQPTILGEPYFNKPPLFNWLIVLYAKLLGWDVVTARAVSVTFTFLNGLLVALLLLSLGLKPEKALLGFLAFVTLADVLFWYGWLAEIDVTLTFFTFLLFLSLWRYRETRRLGYLYAASLLTGVTFMLKGFPAFAFFGLSLLALAVYERRFLFLFSRSFLAAYALALVSSLWWLPLSDYPLLYLKTLWRESFSRVESSKDAYAFLKHLITYPLLNFKQLLPLSPFVLYALWRYRPALDRPYRFFALLAGFNYLPYLLSAASRGRYVLPLFPLVTVIGVKLLKERLVKLFLLAVGVAVLLRLLFGLFYLPYLNEKRGKPKEKAYELAKLVEGHEVACNCPKDFCLYLDFYLGRPLYKERLVPGWRYLVDCKERPFKLVRRYRLGSKEVFVYERAVGAAGAN
ncbi:MAG: glycosyl transferase [Aquificae bacterium]|nr:glycosyl transferase [Aquificota bacterium]